MFKYLAFAPIILFISVATAMGPGRTEFVSGDGFLRSSFGISVEFTIDASQQDPNAANGTMSATLYSFPQHPFMTFMSTQLDSVDVNRRSAGVSGAAFVVDSRSGFEGVVEFSAEFEDVKSRKKNQTQNDRMILTLILPTGIETFAGGIVPGGVEVGTRKP
jgi:hypothetical protein